LPGVRTLQHYSLIYVNNFSAKVEKLHLSRT